MIKVGLKRSMTTWTDMGELLPCPFLVEGKSALDPEREAIFQAVLDVSVLDIVGILNGWYWMVEHEMTVLPTLEDLS